MAEPKTKGVALIHMAEFIQETWGADGFARYLKALPEDLRGRLQQPNATEWYSLAGHAESIKRLADLFYGGDYSKTDVVGVHNLNKSVNGVYRLVVRLLEPEFLIRKSARLWSAFVDTGTLQVERVGERQLRIWLEGIRSPHPAWCHSVGGSFVGALQACHAKDAKSVHDRCVANGAAACEYQVSWS